MKYITLHPGFDLDIVEAEKIGLADLQHHVGGSITSSYVPELSKIGVTVFANDNGLYEGLRPNLAWMVESIFGPEPMVLVGGLVFAAHDREGETVGLSETQIEAVKAWITETREGTPGVMLRILLGRR